MRGRPRGVLAAVLQLVVLGLGDVYNGETRRGWALFAVRLAVGLGGLLALSVLLTAAPSGWTLGAYVPVLLAVLGLYVYGCERAYAEAVRVEEPPRRRLGACVSYALCAWLLSVLAAFLVRSVALQAFKIPSGAMQPTVQIGDRLLVNKFVYGARLESPFSDVPLARLPALRAPAPGDVVVFLAPPQASADRRRRDFIKRVIAVEGQTIEVRAKQVYIDGKPWDDPHATFLTGKPDPTVERPPNPLVRPCGSLESGSGPNCTPYTVPPGHVFVMGDNREQSYDSRFWGPVPISDIKGQALIIYWSWDGPDRWVRWDRIGRLVY
jgi:signal peptidase I